ncbi:hypothetical protein PQE66_gp172 [Bacillus phage PBC2]|uniref:DUF4177 domain-containing protein n=1 Tax=Bacillus phage PBC2 TaxID=1675029 RepID=A0A218KC68_9CAUD|nr:hypothetical protein PQE66_gp172 [Bacillus phage PBC2]AKQ08487.1 hypothetical protein PBC2_172 [Bacillus phage PBC2]
MGKIIMDVKTVKYEYEEGFSSRVMREVNKMQEKGWTVEVQYSTSAEGGFPSMKHSAMIIGKI